jgi:hypothetical protein
MVIAIFVALIATREFLLYIPQDAELIRIRP